MSRIGKAPITIPEGVEVKVTPDTVLVKGKLGELSQDISKEIMVSVNESIISLSRETESKENKSLHGLYRALIYNMIEGVSKGYSVELEMIGVGYRAKTTGQRLELAVGFSHPIFFEIPKEIKITATSEKGKNPLLKLESFDKQLLGQVAAKIRSFRKPEPYKGKGIRYKNEYVRRKVGKSAAK
jgi:large subunit ribosomal protein L6